MIEWLYRIFVGHNHIWVPVKNYNVYDTGKKVEIIMVMQCGTCGNIKQVKIKGT